MDAPHAHENIFRTSKALALLPLLLLGAGAWYFLRGRDLPAERPGDVAQAKIFDQEGRQDGQAPSAKAGEGLAAARIPEAYDPKAGMEIRGSAEFEARVLSALKLVWTSDRDAFAFIRRSLQAIRSENRTGFYMDNGKAVAALSNDHAFRSATWCAGVIAHQAWHAAYSRSGGRKGAGPPPPPGETRELKVDANPVRVDYKDLGDLLRAEDKAFEFQLRVLRAVGAPAAETGPVFRRAPRDFHLAHDGNYSLNP